MELADLADDGVLDEDISKIDLGWETDLSRVLIDSDFANFKKPRADWLDETLHCSRPELGRTGGLGS